MARLRIALEWFLNPDHVPLLIGIEEGWFAEAGLEVELLEPKEHFDAFKGMVDGKVDIAITEPIHLLQDLAEGEKLQGFARFLHTNGGVMVLERSGITRPRELAGKRIQYPGAPGPGGKAIVNTMVRADGGEPEALTPVNLGFHHTEALFHDKADAATLVFYNFEVLEARHKGLEPRLFSLKDWGVPDFCQLIFTALPATIETREDDLRAFLAVIRRGIDLIKQDPARAEAIHWKATGGDPNDPLGNAMFAATVACFTHDLGMSHDYYRALGAWMIETDQAESFDDLDGCWTNRLVYS